MNRVFKHLATKLGGQAAAKLDQATEITTNEELSKIQISFVDRTIVTVLSDGTHILNSGGWRTPAVRKKIESFIHKLGLTIVQRNGIWYVCYISVNRPVRYVFTDGMKIDAKGNVSGAERAGYAHKPSQREIKKYVQEWCRAWERGAVKPSNPSDPHTFYSVASKRDRPNYSEMRQQMQDYYQHSYYFGSLIMAAIAMTSKREQTQVDLVSSFHIEGWLKHGMLPESKLLTESCVRIRRFLKAFLFKLHGISGTNKKTTNGKES